MKTTRVLAVMLTLAASGISQEALTERNTYEEAMGRLVKAQKLWNEGNFLSGAEEALAAYDDFLEVPPTKAQPKALIRQRRKEAATLYVEATIRQVMKSLKENKRTPEVLADARSRLEDMEDVAKEYPVLHDKMKTAIQLIEKPAP